MAAGIEDDVTDAPRRRNVPAFFGLALAMSLPFFLLGWAADVQVLPGLPLSALMAVVPALAAAILAFRAEGETGLRAFLGRSLDARRVPPAWWAPVLLTMPALMVLLWLVMRAAGDPLPAPVIPLWAPFAMMAAFFVGGLGEELGWTGYAIDPLQARFGPLGAALLLGVIWAGWHLIPFLEGGRGWSWIAWHMAGMPATRVIMLWLYNRTRRSVCAVALFHATDNTSAFLFPVWGSFYDPRLAALILIAVATLIVLIDRDAFREGRGSPAAARR